MIFVSFKLTLNFKYKKNIYSFDRHKMMIKWVVILDMVENGDAERLKSIKMDFFLRNLKRKVVNLIYIFNRV